MFYIIYINGFIQCTGVYSALIQIYLKNKPLIRYINEKVTVVS